MRRCLALLLAAALACSLAACGEGPMVESPSAEPSVRPTQLAVPVSFSLGYDPNGSLHPITGGSQVNLALAALVYQGLYELDNTFSPQPVLAQDASVSEDGLTWTITIRADAQFSSGVPLTAREVAASLNAARSSTLYADRLSAVTSVQAGEGTVTITLSAPNGALPALLDIPVTLEQEDGLPLGTGRYCYVAGEDTLSLAVNPYYPDRAALPFQTILLQPVSSADDRIAAFDSGLISAVTTDFSSAYALGYSSSYETCDYPDTTMLYVGFRTTGGPCQRALVRQAFSRAFDRESLVGTLLSGHGDAASLPISPLHGEYREDAAALLDYDLEAAAGLLGEAGYTVGEDDLLYSGRTPLSVTLIVNSDSTAKQSMADALADSLSGLGVTVTVRKLPWKDYTAALAAGNFDLYIGEVRMTGDFDCTSLLTGELNYGGYTGEELIQAMSAWRAARGAARDQAAADLWQAFTQEAPVAVLCFKRGSLLVRWGIVTNVQPTRADPFRGMESWTVVQ